MTTNYGILGRPRLLVFLWIGILGAFASCAAIQPIPANNEATKVKLFNTSVLNTLIDKPVTLLTDGSGTNPIAIQVDIKDGQYRSATLTYPSSISIDEVRDLINASFASYEKQTLRSASGSVWRITDREFAIALSLWEGQYPQLMYFAFEPMNEVFKNMLDAGVFAP